METKIMDLILEYTYSNKFIDNDYIDRLISIVVSEKDISKYVRKVTYTNDLEKNKSFITFANYSPIDMEIILDYSSIDMLLKRKTKYNHLFNRIEQKMYKIITITQYILHELEHAYQNKLADKKSMKSIELKLIKACFILEKSVKNSNFIKELEEDENLIEDFIQYLLKYKQLYYKFYSVNPVERLAQINSHYTLFKALKPLGKEYPNIYEFYKASLLEQKLKGYPDAWEYGMCPTEVYLSVMDLDSIWKNMKFFNSNQNMVLKNVSEQYDLSKRLTYGLPVDKEEYNILNEWLGTTNKFNFR